MSLWTRLKLVAALVLLALTLGGLVLVDGILAFVNGALG